MIKPQTFISLPIEDIGIVTHEETLFDLSMVTPIKLGVVKVTLIPNSPLNRVECTIEDACNNEMFKDWLLRYRFFIRDLKERNTDKYKIITHIVNGVECRTIIRLVDEMEYNSQPAEDTRVKHGNRSAKKYKMNRLIHHHNFPAICFRYSDGMYYTTVKTVPKDETFTFDPRRDKNILFEKDLRLRNRIRDIIAKTNAIQMVERPQKKKEDAERVSSIF